MWIFEVLKALTRPLFYKRLENITFSGRFGLLYKRGDIVYYIDSEWLAEKQVDIVLYHRDIFLQKDKSIKIPAHERQVIVLEVEKALKQSGYKVELNPNYFE